MRLLCAAILLFLAQSATAQETLRRVDLTPKMQRGLAADLQAQGYNCPRAKLAFVRPPSAYGNVIQIICGPRGRDEIYEGTSFRLTYHPNGGVSIVPCDAYTCAVEN